MDGFWSQKSEHLVYSDALGKEYQGKEILWARLTEMIEILHGLKYTMQPHLLQLWHTGSCHLFYHQQYHDALIDGPRIGSGSSSSLPRGWPEPERQTQQKQGRRSTGEGYLRQLGEPRGALEALGKTREYWEILSYLPSVINRKRREPVKRLHQVSLVCSP